jgi:aromatic-L-amino-acid decarboxylase
MGTSAGYAASPVTFKRPSTRGSGRPIDPVAGAGAVAARHGLWHHVDAAMAGSAGVVPELRFVNDGLELADSYCFDPHKWLFTNLECDAFFVADRRPLIAALSVLPEYLRNAASESGAVVDFRDWHLPLGRRFRALKLWFVLRHYGAAGLRHHVAAHVRWAHELAERLDADPRFELAAPVPLNLVCFRHVDGDEAGARLLAAVNASGRAFLTHTRLDGRYVLRVSVGQTSTERRHVLALLDLLDELA